MDMQISSDASLLNAVAIVGIGCRFPGDANNPQSLLSMLLRGQDAISEIPEDRWAIERYYHPRKGVAGKSVTKWGGFVRDIDRFDAEFFGISPREAATMDPQQRMLLEVCWEAMEDAGCVPYRLRGRQVGVFVGGFTLDYMLMQLGSDSRAVQPHTATGSMMTLLANRLSYVFDFRGPSLAVDTACSSSLVAVHLACRSLIDGESELAVAGGVNALLSQSYTVAESRAGMMSSTGRSRAFDSRADGYVRGEGAGLVMLKRLSRALADGDHVYSVICATGVNQDGHSDGLTVPSGAAQSALMRSTLNRAQVQPNQLSFVEAHGTGTPVGDPIEAGAIGGVVSEGRPEGDRCWVGSIKTNIGHTEAAAGVAGLIKSALMLEARTVPPHLHLQRVNPAIDLAALRLKIAPEVQALPSSGVLFASVNSFGFGGTNAHAVMATPPEVSNIVPPASVSCYTLPLSARDARVLPQVAGRFADFLSQSEVSLADVCDTAAMRREHHAHRAAVTGRSVPDLCAALRALAEDLVHPAAVSGVVADDHAAELVFVYSGMGPQWWAMGRQLYAAEPVFQQAADHCMGIFERIAGWSLREALFADETSSRMAETEVAQPANFVVQASLTALLASWGIRPQRIVGHSAGEPAAAYAAGVFTLDDATRIICARSRWQQTTSGQGGLLALGLSPERALEEVSRQDDASLSLAAVNGPETVTVVGSQTAVAAMHQRLDAAGVFARILKVRVPYHSVFMESLRVPLLAELRDITPRPAKVALFSTVTGVAVTGTEMDAEYWYRNVRQPVQFLDATKALLAQGSNTFLELSPHPVLLSSIKETAAVVGAAVHTVSTLRRDSDEVTSTRQVIAALHVQGYAVDWRAAQGAGHWTRLPTYPWRNTRFWYETPWARNSRLTPPEHPILNRRVDAHVPTWEADLEGIQLAFLDDHRIQGVTVFPGAGYISMALHAARSLYGSTDIVALRDVVFERALYFSADQPMTLRLSVDPDTQVFTIASQGYGATTDTWERHASGRFVLTHDQHRGTADFLALRAACSTRITREACYRHFRNLGLEYGPVFQGIQELWQGDSEALARIEVPQDLVDSLSHYDVHPAVLDVGFQTLAAALPMAGDAKTVYMPTGVTEGRRYGQVTRHMWIHARITASSSEGLSGDIRLYDENGSPVIEIDCCTARALGAQALQATPQGLYQPNWLPCARGKLRGYATQGTWIVYGGTTELSDGTAAALRQAGRTVVQFRNDAFDAQDADAWRSRLVEQGALLRGVVHLDAVRTTDQPVADMGRGCLVALALTRALTGLNLAQRPRLWIVTRATQPVAGDSVAHPFTASVWGLGRVIGHAEHVEVWGGLLDLAAYDLAEDGAHIALECLTPDVNDEIAWRRGERYVSRLQSCAPDVNRQRPVQLRADASYLITGGLGALGLEVAQWMARHGARHLVLVGREALPERSQWRSKELPARERNRIAAILAIEAQGCQVRVEALDISDSAAVEALMRRHKEGCYPDLRGVVHSAGVARPQLMAEMSAAEFAAVFPGKVQGAWNLHNAVRGQVLDFFVMFSSVAGVITSMGQGNYAAANAALDALAHWRRACGFPAVSIDWGPWGDVGMATQLDLLKFFNNRGLFPMTAVQGTTAFGQLLYGQTAQAVVLGVHWKTLADTSPLSIPAPLITQMVEEEAQRENAQNSATGTPVDFKAVYRECADTGERQALLQQQLHGLVCSILRVEEAELAIQDTLNSHGMDSMMAIELRNRIEHTLGVRIAIVDLLKGATVQSLSLQMMPELDAVLRPVDVPDASAEALVAALARFTPEQIDALLSEAATEGEVR